MWPCGSSGARVATKALIAGALAILALPGCSPAAPVGSPPSGTPAGPALTASPTPGPTASPSPSPVLSAFVPSGVGLWTSSRALVVGALTDPVCQNAGTCTGGLVERSVDGGRTWSVVDRTVAIYAVATEGSEVAWVVTACPQTTAAGCGIARTSNGGTTWVTTPNPGVTLTSLAPVSASAAWAVSGWFGAAP